MINLLLASQLIIPHLNQPLAIEPSASHITIHCPAAESIVVTTIPSSFHSVMSATSAEGVAFGTFGTALGDPSGLEVYGAEISEVNSYYRMSCGYKKGGFGFTLATRDDLAYAQCHFWNGEQVCEGGIEDCSLICPAEAFPQIKTENPSTPKAADGTSK